MTIRVTTRTTITLQPADIAWIVLWGWVFGFNTWAARRRKRGDTTAEQLSEACDRYLTKWRWPTEVWLLLFYIHLSNRVADRYDPIHWVSTVADRWWQGRRCQE